MFVLLVARRGVVGAIFLRGDLMYGTRRSRCRRRSGRQRRGMAELMRRDFSREGSTSQSSESPPSSPLGHGRQAGPASRGRHCKSGYVFPRSELARRAVLRPRRCGPTGTGARTRYGDSAGRRSLRQLRPYRLGVRPLAKEPARRRHECTRPRGRRGGGVRRYRLYAGRSRPRTSQPGTPPKEARFYPSNAGVKDIWSSLSAYSGTSASLVYVNTATRPGSVASVFFLSAIAPGIYSC